MRDVSLPEPDPGTHWEFRRNKWALGPHFILVDSANGNEIGFVFIDSYGTKSGVVRAAKKVIEEHRFWADSTVLEYRYPRRFPTGNDRGRSWVSKIFKGGR